MRKEKRLYSSFPGGIITQTSKGNIFLLNKEELDMALEEKNNGLINE